mmetsp:Transcript_20966/g.46985  ORF Transcript_20966/g.46985 Transcript_20966/m.46985 type:complete len:212 (-) Transcript_20966:186-821(-)
MGWDEIRRPRSFSSFSRCILSTSFAFFSSLSASRAHITPLPVPIFSCLRYSAQRAASDNTPLASFRRVIAGFDPGSASGAFRMADSRARPASWACCSALCSASTGSSDGFGCGATVFSDESRDESRGLSTALLGVSASADAAIRAALSSAGEGSATFGEPSPSTSICITSLAARRCFALSGWIFSAVDRYALCTFEISDRSSAGSRPSASK